MDFSTTFNSLPSKLDLNSRILCVNADLSAISDSSKSLRICFGFISFSQQLIPFRRIEDESIRYNLFLPGHFLHSVKVLLNQIGLIVWLQCRRWTMKRTSHQNHSKSNIRLIFRHTIQQSICPRNHFYSVKNRFLPHMNRVLPINRLWGFVLYYYNV